MYGGLYNFLFTIYEILIRDNVAPRSICSTTFYAFEKILYYKAGNIGIYFKSDVNTTKQNLKTRIKNSAFNFSFLYYDVFQRMSIRRIVLIFQCLLFSIYLVRVIIALLLLISFANFNTSQH